MRRGLGQAEEGDVFVRPSVLEGDRVHGVDHRLLVVSIEVREVVVTTF